MRRAEPFEIVIAREALLRRSAAFRLILAGFFPFFGPTARRTRASIGAVSGPVGADRDKDSPPR
ncbi:hypothetical protein ASG48_16600 [Aurantimonas sp. Leaf443]|nr:hypothetical protein ASG48_16600 [Aurantimonas sp. Leaf443]